MAKDYSGLSEEELKEMIKTAGVALQSKEEDRKQQVISQINELAASINLKVEFINPQKRQSSRKGIKVAAKYQNPANPSQKWTGRGMKPKWLKALLDQGGKAEQYEI